jgi:GNAT superfamily N-acetyltransferase
LVLKRLAFKSGITVVGGSSKLLKYFYEYAKKHGFKKIISWSDNRYSEGNVYKKLGFKLTEEIGPDYGYVRGLIFYSKQSLNKKRLSFLGATGKTEREMALSLGYYRIWDCGKKRWVIDL